MLNEDDDIMSNSGDKKVKKQFLHDLFERLGTDPKYIENHTTMAEYMDYLMARPYEDEVLRERRMASLAGPSVRVREIDTRLSDSVAQAREERKLKNVSIPELLKHAYSSLDKQEIKDEVNSYMNEEVHNVYRRRDIKQHRSMITINGVKKMLPALEINSDEEFARKLGEFEGNYEYPYLDSQNIMTVGPGINIQENFYDHPWVDLQGNLIKDRKILQRELEKIKAIAIKQELLKKSYSKTEMAKHMRTAVSFKNETILRLPESYLKELKERKINEMTAELQSNIDNFNKLNGDKYGRRILDLDEMPRNYAKVLLELKYNLGGNKFNSHTYSKLFKGLILGDKEIILDNLSRIVNNANDEKRNQWAKKLIENTRELPSVQVRRISDLLG